MLCSLTSVLSSFCPIDVKVLCAVLFFKGTCGSPFSFGEGYPFVLSFNKVRCGSSGARALSEFVAPRLEACPNLPVKVCQYCNA